MMRRMSSRLVARSTCSSLSSGLSSATPASSDEDDVQDHDGGERDAAQQARVAPPETIAARLLLALGLHAPDQPVQLLDRLGLGGEADHDGHDGIGDEG